MGLGLIATTKWHAPSKNSDSFMQAACESQLGINYVEIIYDKKTHMILKLHNHEDSISVHTVRQCRHMLCDGRAPIPQVDPKQQTTAHHR